AVLCEGLKLHNYEACAVHTGTEALDLCAGGGIDLVLLDVCLPDISGYEVCQRLKQAPATREISIIFVTVKGSPQEVAKGFSLGAADYICKPYNLPMVMVRVDAAMREKRRRDRLRLEHELLLEETYTDHLTGLHNRRYLLERLQEEVEKAHRYNYPVSCVVFDVDEVRPVDDELGPVSMDDLLAEVGMTIRNYSRTYDVLARYDGTMFAAILPHVPLEDAHRYAVKIMNEVGSTTYSDPNFPTETSVSVGIVACQNGSAQGAEYVLGEAMRGLLQAKSLGERLVVRNLAEG
ncbi:MAG TPA: diguanylate cyclase, partial [Candidatus Bathyarchaeia archaeon]|nr:diguanylate cyclase [Candidatus Bathyarchaeia archaeon]